MRNFKFDRSRGCDPEAVAEAIDWHELRKATDEEENRYAEAVAVGRIVKGPLGPDCKLLFER